MMVVYHQLGRIAFCQFAHVNDEKRWGIEIEDDEIADIENAGSPFVVVQCDQPVGAHGQQEKLQDH